METMPTSQAIHLNTLSQDITEVYRDMVINEVNESSLHLVVNDGQEFAWHSHPTSDELFLILEGELIIDIQGRDSQTLSPHTILTIPAGTIHRVHAHQRTVLVLFEKTHAATAFQESRT